MSLRLDWCSHEAAKFAVMNWHYSKTMPRSKNNYLGVWEDGEFIGALVFGLGAGNATSGTQWGLGRYFEVCELERVALKRGHKAPVSKVVAIAIRMVAARNPGIRVIVSFADPYRGHHGGIYQAGGWIYVGDTSKGKVFIDKSGKEHHSRHVSENGFKNHWGKAIPALRPSEAREVISTDGKHKYLMPLDAEMRALIAPLAKPYPKRVRSIDSDAPGFQSGEGGAIPTRTLQSGDV